MKHFIIATLAIPVMGLAQKPKTDTTKKIAPVTKVSPFKNAMDSFSYAIGVNIAFNMKQEGLQNINTSMVTRAFNDVLSGKQPILDIMACNNVVNKTFSEIAAKKSKAIKQEGEKFLNENKKRKEVTTTASGLQYEIVKEGNGPKPTDTNTVKVHYTGTLINGKKFDSSVDRGQPAEFPVTGVIAGWTEALKLMPVGSKWKLYIPSSLAYGDRGAGQDIPPGATLIFEVELLEIVK